MSSSNPKKHKISKPKLKGVAWEMFSVLTRAEDFVRNGGFCCCVTCGKTFGFRESQAGHFIPRGFAKWSFSHDNVHVQDYQCNIAMKGNYPAYRDFMVSRYGKDHVESMEALRHEMVKRSSEDWVGLIEDLASRLQRIHEMCTDDYVSKRIIDSVKKGSRLVRLFRSNQ